jgi:hypothetical protein
VTAGTVCAELVVKGAEMKGEIAANSKEAVLLLAHGTPDVLGEMEDCLKLVTSGRVVPAQIVQELQEMQRETGEMVTATVKDTHSLPKLSQMHCPHRQPER